jgi:hypothetical protein
VGIRSVLFVASDTGSTEAALSRAVRAGFRNCKVHTVTGYLSKYWWMNARSESLIDW